MISLLSETRGVLDFLFRLFFFPLSLFWPHLPGIKPNSPPMVAVAAVAIYAENAAAAAENKPTLSF